MSAIVAVLIISSGLQGLQTASLVAALPLTFIVFLMGFSLIKSLSKGESVEEEIEECVEVNEVEKVDSAVTHQPASSKSKARFPDTVKENI